MTNSEDEAFDAALARALGPNAEDTAPLARAVLTRISEQTSPPRTTLAEVLSMPLPATGLMFGALLLAGALGYALPSGEVDETMLLQVLIGVGF